MSKYFELLRSHHPKKSIPDKAEDLSTDPAEMASIQNTIPPSQQPENLEVLLDEQSVSGTHAIEEDLDPQSLLVIEDEAEDPASPLDALSKNEFNISTWLKNIKLITLHIFQAAQQQQSVTITPLNNYLQLFMTQLEKNPDMLNSLDLEANHYVQQNATDDELNDLVQKSIILMLHMMRTGLYLQQTHSDNRLQENIVAAMLHHIGMVSVANDIRNKAAKLTREEKECIKLAPVYGAAYLKTCNIEKDSSILAAAQATAYANEGAEAEDTQNNGTPWLAQMINLLSMFESLTHHRSYRAALIPRDAICDLVNNHKKRFASTMLKALIESITLYPVGIFVQLNTGDIGQVVATNNQYPLRPTVIINTDKHGHTLDKRQVNLKEHPNLTIQESMFTIAEKLNP